MIKTIKFKQILRKDIPTIYKYLGGFYAIIGAFSLMVMKLQMVMLSNYDFSTDDSFSSSIKVIQDVWMTYMPLLVLLGLGYFIYGYCNNRIKGKKLWFHDLLGLLSLVWSLAYSLDFFSKGDSLFPSTDPNFEAFIYVEYTFSILGFLIVIAIMTIPQYLIRKRLKNQLEKNNNAT